MASRPRTAAAVPVRPRGRRRVPREREREPVVTIEHATEDDPAVADAAVRFLRRAMELGGKE